MQAMQAIQVMQAMQVMQVMQVRQVIQVIHIIPIEISEILHSCNFILILIITWWRKVAGIGDLLDCLLPDQRTLGIDDHDDDLSLF